MNKIIKYSKSYKKIDEIKSDFTSLNSIFLNKVKKINKIYKKQPIRKNCKICNSTNLQSFIFSFDIEYRICKNCSHLNGKYQDTKKFANLVYKDYFEEMYAKRYKKDFNKRVKYIYTPKIKFLKKVIKKKIKLIDIGSGHGHLIKACQNLNVSAVGFEVSKKLVNLAKNKLRTNSIFHVDPNKIPETIIKDKTSNVISLIGVLEHVISPNLILDSFRKVKYNIYIYQYLYYLSRLLLKILSGMFSQDNWLEIIHICLQKSL